MGKLLCILYTACFFYNVAYGKNYESVSAHIILDTFNKILPGYGNDFYNEDQPIIHPMALAHYTTSAILMENKEALSLGANQLLAIVSTDNKNNGVGWGLGFPFRTFKKYRSPNDITVNPAISIYGITDALVVEALLRAYETTGNILFREAAFNALNYYLHSFNRINDSEGFFWYSDQQNDRNFTVHNVTSMLMGVYAYAYAISGNDLYLAVATKCFNYLLKKHNQQGGWPYMSNKEGENFAVNDPVHNALTVQGFINYKKFAKSDVAITEILEDLDQLVSEMEIDSRLQLRAVGQVMYTLVEAGKPHSAHLIKKLILPKFYKKNGYFRWRLGDDESYVRDTAFLLAGIARLEQAEIKKY